MSHLLSLFSQVKEKGGTGCKEVQIRRQREIKLEGGGLQAKEGKKNGSEK